MEEKIFYCMRPTIVTTLVSRGFRATRVPNIYHEDYPCWSFEVDKNLATNVAELYGRIGKTVPPIISSVLDNEDSADE